MPTPFVKLEEMVRGDGKVIVVQVVDGQGVPLDLTDKTLWFTAKGSFDSDGTDGAAIISKSTDVGAGITLLPQVGATVGHAEVWIDSDDTDSFPAERTKVLYDVQYQETGLDPVTIVRGDWTIIPDVTRRVTLP